MDYLQNHIWCSDSNWGGEYDCRHLVSFSCYKDHEKDDWERLIDVEAEDIVVSSLYELAKGSRPDLGEDQLISMCTRSVPNLKPYVLAWLEDNVKDRNGVKSPKGWAIGSPQYRYNDMYSFSVFFHRKSDAMAFVREFSKYKKPVIYHQYFTDTLKTLDLNTGTYTNGRVINRSSLDER